LNYAENTVHWKPVDLVVHDADAKREYMLMRVIGYASDGRYRTEYVDKDQQKRWNHSGEGPLLNRLAVLHDSKRFCLKHHHPLEQGPCLCCLFQYTADPFQHAK
jgi:hypothetical protein